MVSLIFSEKYKSIDSLEPVELPKFTVLTGKNGSGKTHLLEAINGGQIRTPVAVPGQAVPQIRLYNWQNLIPNDEGAIDRNQINQERTRHWDLLSPHTQQADSQIENFLAQNPELRAEIGPSIRRSLLYPNATRRRLSEENAPLFDQLQQIASSQSQNAINLAGRRDPNVNRLLTAMQEISKKPLVLLNRKDFGRYFPFGWTYIDPFQQSFGRLFASYEKTKEDNEFLQFRKKEKGHDVEPLTDEEFLKEHGAPPWEFVNDVLQRAGLGFQITTPDLYDETSNYVPRLIHPRTNDELAFADLSSGERVILSFALCLYYSTDSRQLIQYPKLLLFDEIDATLHPSMVQSVLGIINDVLVVEKDIPVILTTHSPSTVALAPEGAVFAINGESSKTVVPVERDRAIAILTAGIPALSVNYDLRRQVFTESKHDAEFLERLFGFCNAELKSEISLNFISSGPDGSGSDKQVLTAVKLLRKNGVKTVFGVIDWDGKNTGSDHVLVLGDCSRHSLENFILDPLALACLCVRDRVLAKEDCGLEEGESYIDAREFDSGRAQKLVDAVVVRLLPNANELERTVVQYCGGATASVPKSLLLMRGHDLEELIKNTFPRLKQYTAESALKREVVLGIYAEMPGLIPSDLITTFSGLQSLGEKLS
ncbi:MAG: AAA family ATPase [Pseudomonadota bacterium]